MEKLTIKTRLPKYLICMLLPLLAFVLAPNVLQGQNGGDEIPPIPPSHDLVGELTVKEVKATSQRVADSLHFETFNTDPTLFGPDGIWVSLFGVEPVASVDDLLTLQGDHLVTWDAGTLTMGGNMKLKVKTDKKDPTLKEIKIEKAGKNDGITTFISGTGGVNPNLADGGWHEVKIKNMDGVTVTFVTDTGSYTVTGFLKELKVKLDQDSTTVSPIVREFKLKLKAETTIPDIKKGIVSSVTVDVPETVVTALAGTEYEEKVKAKPELVSGHTEAEFERDEGAVSEGVNISSLLDGFNNQLKERKGPVTIVLDGAPEPDNSCEVGDVVGVCSDPSISPLCPAGTDIFDIFVIGHLECQSTGVGTCCAVGECGLGGICADSAAECPSLQTVLFAPPGDVWVHVASTSPELNAQCGPTPRVCCVPPSSNGTDCPPLCAGGV